MKPNVVKLAEQAKDDPIDLLEEVLVQLKTASREAGERAEEALEEAMRSVAKAARHLTEDVQDEGKRLLKKTRKAVEHHPRATAAVAAAAIALAGLVVTQKLRNARNR